MMPISFSSISIVIYFVGLCTINAMTWDLKTFNSAFRSHLPAISLEDHRTAFSLASYCVGTNDGGGTKPNGLVRDICDKCPNCAWKKRMGFETEEEWEEAVAIELERLSSSETIILGPSGRPTGLNHPELVGTWVVEAPFSMHLTEDILEELGPSLGVSFTDLVVSEQGARRFFVVSATPRLAEGLLDAGFSSVTPIPPRLKVDPSIEEEAATTTIEEEQLRSSPPHADGFFEKASDRGLQEDEEEQGLYVHLSTPTAMIPPSHYTNATTASASLLYSSSAAASSATSTSSAAVRLSTEWSKTVPRRLGHAEAARVKAPSGTVVTVDGLRNRFERYEVALAMAMHGEVTWVSYSTTSVAPANAYAAKIVQKWPPYSSGGEFLLYDGHPARNNGSLSALPVFSRSGGRATKKTGRGQKEKVRAGDAPLHDLGIFGKGATVGVADFGLDHNSCFFRDENVALQFGDTSAADEGRHSIWESETHRKIRMYTTAHRGQHGADYGGDGHGTHVCGSVVGNPTTTTGGPSSSSSPAHDGDISLYSGVAPAAKLAFHDLYDAGAKTKEIPGNAGSFYDLVYPAGVRIYSISWGSHTKQDIRYKPVAKTTDDYCYVHQDFIVIAAAGNSGAASWPDHLPQAPANSKNAVAVGSHMNQDKAHTRRMIAHLSPNSSRGPTLDGRIKPDICAPGDVVHSAAIGPSPGVQTCTTVGKKGTSMATAIVSGVTILIREYFTKGYYPLGVRNPKNKYVPMGALLKALLVNSARPLVIVDSPKDKRVNVPNGDQGWGGVDVSTTIVTPASPKGLALRVYGEWSTKCKTCPIVKQGEVRSYKLMVNTEYESTVDDDDDDIPLKVTLVWYDKAAVVNAESLVISNLDLTIEAPDGTIHYPNGGAEADPVNNVEHIAIPSPIPVAPLTAKMSKNQP